MSVVRQPLHTRERTEELERASLSIWGALASETKGRDRHEEPDPLRTVFQQDRDRIASARAFLRLAGKSHILLPSGAPSRTRLDHTLKVVATARTIARALRGNEDLAEAVALGHAVGCPAYGTAGVEAVAGVIDVAFRPGEHAVRVVERLEDDGRGLNLTWEVRDGLLNAHSQMPKPATLEGQVVGIAIRIEDAVIGLTDVLAAGLVARADLPGALEVAGSAPGRWRESLLAGVITNSTDQPEVRLPSELLAGLDAAGGIVAAALRGSAEARSEHDRAEHCLRSLLVFHLQDPFQIPAERPDSVPVQDRVLDFVIGLTDEGARREFARRFAPHALHDGPE
jgi:dGTPase